MLINNFIIYVFSLVLVKVKSDSYMEENENEESKSTIECFTGNKILPDDIYSVQNCSGIEGIQKVTCFNNITSCFATLNYNNEITLGCDEEKYCMLDKKPKKTLFLVCCETDLCNCGNNGTQLNDDVEL